MPVPVSATVCGLPNALSVIESVPVAVPTAVGANTTLIVQLAPMARPDPHVFVWVNAPFVVTLDIVSTAVPVFVSVTG